MKPSQNTHSTPASSPTPASADSSAVLHDEPVGSFKILTDRHLLSHLDYILEGSGNDTRMVCTHTYVPPELRGRGLAEQLARAALDEARRRHWRVVPACSYVEVFLQRHPEFGDIVA